MITIVGSCYGFSVLDEINSQKFSSKYEYEMYAQPLGVSPVNYSGSDSGFTDSQLGEVRSIPYAGNVNASKSCKGFLVSDKLSDYQKHCFVTTVYFGLLILPI